MSHSHVLIWGHCALTWNIQCTEILLKKYTHMVFLLYRVLEIVSSRFYTHLQKDTHDDPLSGISEQCKEFWSLFLRPWDLHTGKPCFRDEGFVNSYSFYRIVIIGDVSTIFVSDHPSQRPLSWSKINMGVLEISHPRARRLFCPVQCQV